MCAPADHQPPLLRLLFQDERVFSGQGFELPATGAGGAAEPFRDHCAGDDLAAPNSGGHQARQVAIPR